MVSESRRYQIVIISEQVSKADNAKYTKSSEDSSLSVRADNRERCLYVCTEQNEQIEISCSE